MNFRSEIQCEKFPFQCNHASKFLLMGSCFSESISEKLFQNGYFVHHNPFGNIFNPLSIADHVIRLIHKSNFDPKYFVFRDDHYFSYHTHSEIFAHTATELESILDQKNSDYHQHLKNTSVLIITLGTAFVYELKEGNVLVANCQKQTSTLFIKRLLTTEECVRALSKMVKELQHFNPDLKIIFTVSPVRHLRDGITENQKSKSTLHLAIAQLMDVHQNCYYFPAYEIMMDDLRDYRFYKSDLIHPNEMAVEYIWDKFRSSIFTNDSLKLASEIHQYYRSTQHQAFRSESKSHQQFLDNLEKKKADLIKLLNHWNFD